MSHSSSVIVVGAGVVGVHSAWALLQKGFKVTLIDQQAAVAQDTSYANGGQLSYGHVEPWASKETYPSLFQALCNETSPILFRPRWDLQQWRWAWSFLKEGTSERYEYNLKRLLALALESRQAHLTLQKKLSIDYDAVNQGILHFYATAKDYQRGLSHAEKISTLGYPRYEIHSIELEQIEPAFKYTPLRFSGATYSPQDASGNARKWSAALAEAFVREGGTLLTSSKVTALEVKEQRCHGVWLDSDSLLEAQQVVLCTASDTQKLLTPHGLQVPIYPVKGYSITLPITQSELIPHVSLTDDQYKLVMTRLGGQLRVAGTAEFVGWDKSINQRRIQALLHRTRQWFPEGLDFTDYEPWAGLRPVTPSGYPLIGHTAIQHLFLNTGHGTLGWTLSAGSAERLAELISQR